jgi:hypothetical protein
MLLFVIPCRFLFHEVHKLFDSRQDKIGLEINRIITTLLYGKFWIAVSNTDFKTEMVALKRAVLIMKIG